MISLKYTALTIVEAEATTANAQRYADACNTHVFYSMRAIRNPKDPNQVKAALQADRFFHNIGKEFCQTTPDKFFVLINLGNTVFFLVDDNNVDHGFAVIKRKSQSVAYIGDFIVYEHLKGYGSHFYQNLEHRLKTLGITQIQLTPFGDGAIVFWEKMGFMPEYFNKSKFFKSLK
jgi:hypothetical protein